MIALDIETTGLTPGKNDMISIGAVQIGTNKEYYTECQVYDETEISNVALSINGFTREEIYDGLKLFPHEVYYDFRQWYEDVREEPTELLIGQNLPSFDIQFLKHYHLNVLGENFSSWPFGHRYLDLHTYVFAKTAKSQSHNETLNMIGMEEEPMPHNALTGAKVVRDIYNSL